MSTGEYKLAVQTGGHGLFAWVGVELELGEELDSVEVSGPPTEDGEHPGTPSRQWLPGDLARRAPPARD